MIFGEIPGSDFLFRRESAHIRCVFVLKTGTHNDLPANHSLNDRETRRYDMFTRVKAFGDDRGSNFAPTSAAKTYFANVAATITALDGQKAQQGRGSRTALEVPLDALRLDVANITRSASAFGQDEPGFGGDFRPPASASHADLLTADAILLRLQAQPGDSPAVAAAKTALTTRFVDHELPADFVTDLAGDHAAITEAQEAALVGDNDGVQSTAAVGRLIREGMKQVNYLDAIMHNKYARSPDKLRAWQSANHIERAPHQEKKPVVVTPPQT